MLLLLMVHSPMLLQPRPLPLLLPQLVRPSVSVPLSHLLCQCVPVSHLLHCTGRTAAEAVAHAAAAHAGAAHAARAAAADAAAAPSAAGHAATAHGAAAHVAAAHVLLLLPQLLSCCFSCCCRPVAASMPQLLMFLLLLPLRPLMLGPVRSLQRSSLAQGLRSVSVDGLHGSLPLKNS